MIRRLQLTNWRSYDSLEVDFEPGTTFVVAPNGVGKTSLVLALAWALYGDQAVGISPKDCIRAGANAASVEVALELRDGSELTVGRSVTQQGKPTVTFRLDGERLAPDAAELRLTDEFSIDLPTAARLSLMLGGGHLESSRALDLESHLHEAFGVADLLRAAEVADATLKNAQSATKRLRDTTKERVADRAGIEAEIEELEHQLHGSHEVTAALEASREAAERARQQAAESAAYHEQVASFTSTLEELRHAFGELVGDQRSAVDTPRDSLLEQINNARTEFEESAADATDQLTHARATTIAAQHARALLEGDHTTCPTCLRAIDSSALAAARAAHHEHADSAIADTSHLETEATAARDRLGRTDKLLTRLQILSPPPPPEAGDVPTDLDVVESTYREARDALRQHSEQIGMLRASLSSLQQQLVDDDETQHGEQRLTEAFRREGIAAAAATALRRAADELTATRIEPIATEVQWRWKQLFSDGGLQLQPDGTITRLAAGQELAWETLSGGEQIWARLITHLLVIKSSTTLPFAWFDEPLEHLDPKLRRTVAGYLAKAATNDSPRQLIVTTYEHALAGQLARDNAQANILSIRQS